MYRYQLSPARGVLSAMHLNLRSRELRKCPVSHLSMWGLFPLRTVPWSVVKLSSARASVTRVVQSLVQCTFGEVSRAQARRGRISIESETGRVLTV